MAIVWIHSHHYRYQATNRQETACGLPFPVDQRSELEADG
jgi:hypothetical protein